MPDLLPDLNDGKAICDLWRWASVCENTYFLDTMIHHVLTRLRDDCWIIPMELLDNIVTLRRTADNRLRRLVIDIFANTATPEGVSALIRRCPPADAAGLSMDLSMALAEWRSI